MVFLETLHQSSDVTDTSSLVITQELTDNYSNEREEQTTATQQGDLCFDLAALLISMTCKPCGDLALNLDYFIKYTYYM